MKEMRARIITIPAKMPKTQIKISIIFIVLFLKK